MSTTVSESTVYYQSVVQCACILFWHLKSAEKFYLTFSAGTPDAADKASPPPPSKEDSNGLPPPVEDGEKAAETGGESPTGTDAASDRIDPIPADLVSASDIESRCVHVHVSIFLECWLWLQGILELPRKKLSPGQPSLG